MMPGDYVWIVRKEPVRFMGKALTQVSRVAGRIVRIEGGVASVAYRNGQEPNWLSGRYEPGAWTMDFDLSQLEPREKVPGDKYEF